MTHEIAEQKSRNSPRCILAADSRLLRALSTTQKGTASSLWSMLNNWFIRQRASCNISNTRKSVSSGYPNPEKWVEKTRRSRVFLTDFEVFGDLMKHSFEFLIWLLKPFIILGEIQRKSSQSFMLLKIRYPNHRHGSDFLCFLFMNY